MRKAIGEQLEKLAKDKKDNVDGWINENTIVHAGPL